MGSTKAEWLLCGSGSCTGLSNVISWWLRVNNHFPTSIVTSQRMINFLRIALMSFQFENQTFSILRVSALLFC
jgi:hypothetical protein